jgi:MarR family transcriptional repressor of emrRAB
MFTRAFDHGAHAAFQSRRGRGGGALARQRALQFYFHCEIFVFQIFLPATMSYPVWSANIDHVEAAMRRVAQRHDGLPVELLVLSRLLVGLGRDLTANSDELLRTHGLGEGDLRVLMLLYGYPGGTANAGTLGVNAAQSPANITRIADGLVERGLITRVPSAEDRRCVMLRITRRGETLVRALLPRVSERIGRSFGGFSAAEIQRLTADLRRIAVTLADIAAAERPAESPAP